MRRGLSYSFTLFDRYYNYGYNIGTSNVYKKVNDVYNLIFSRDYDSWQERHVAEVTVDSISAFQVRVQTLLVGHDNNNNSDYL